MAFAALGSIALLVPLAISPQDGQQEILLQKAIQKETVDGDLNAAIKMYRQIAENPGEDRAVAAKALLQIGKCYEKLGSLEARKAYETLLQQYSDQSEIATEARTRLAALTRSADDGGIRMRKVWDSSAASNAGSLSIDGRFLPYIDWNSGGNVAIRELASGQARLITTSANGPEHFALNPKISPDGKWIAYQWLNDEQTYDLRIVGIDGGNTRVLYAHSDYEVYPDAWFPDGRQIAVRRYMLEQAAKGRPIRTEIALVDVASGSIRVLKTLERPAVTRISYSDDGRYLIYDYPSDKDAGRYDISMLAVDGSGEIPLVRHPANDRLLGRIPETRSLIFRSDRSGTDDLFMLHVSDNGPDGAPEVIKRAIGEIAPVGFANDGSLFFSIYTRSASLRVAPFDMRSGKIQLENAKTYLGSNMSSLWSPDGGYLAFQTERNKPAGPGFPVRQLRLHNMKTGETRETAPHLFTNSLCCWAPDASAIIVRGSDMERQEKHGIYEVELSSGKTNLLFELADRVTADAIWTADRKAIVHSRDGSIVMHDLQTKSETEFSGQFGKYIYAKISPDGESLALGIGRYQGNPSKLFVITINGGMVQELVTLEDPQTIFGDVVWTPDGKYLLFPVEESQNSHILYRISSEGGDPEKLWESKDLIAGVSIHPDGRQVALSSLTQTREIWVMENLRQWINKQ